MVVVTEEPAEGDGEGEVNKISCATVAKSASVLVTARVRRPPLPPHSLDDTGRHAPEVSKCLVLAEWNNGRGIHV